MARSPWRIGAVALMSAVGLVGVGVVVGAGRASPAMQPAPTERANESYSIGFTAGRELARNLQVDELDIDRAAMMQGITDGLEGKATRLSEAEMQRVLAVVHNRVGQERARRQCERDPVFKVESETNAAKAEAAVAEFAKRPGAKKLPSGVVYQVVREGTGQPAGNATGAVVSYHASLADGRTVAHGDSADLATAGLLPGAKELLGAMRVGDRVVAIIPPAAAFGACGRDPDVGPNEAIVIDAELLSIHK